MEHRDNILFTLVVMLTPLSLTAFGGGVSVISELQHQVVDVHRWLTGDEFLALFGISRAAPGPGSMLTTLIGWKVAGVLGALVATVAMFLPSSALCLVFAVIWRRYRGRPWLVRIEQAVAPIGAGLLIAGVISIAELVSAGPGLLAIAAASTAICLVRPSIHPFVVISLGAGANLALLAAR